MTDENFDLTHLERRILGSFLVDNRRIRNLIRTGEIVADYFNDPANRLVWIAIVGLVNKGQIANPVTVRQWIEERELRGLEDVGGARYLAMLASSAVGQDQVPALLKTWQEAHPQAKADWQSWYNAYLNTDAWRTRRTKVLNRCGGICEGCREVPAIQVHHLTYDHVGEEFLFELVGLCEECHNRVHNGERSNRNE